MAVNGVEGGLFSIQKTIERPNWENRNSKPSTLNLTKIWTGEKCAPFPLRQGQLALSAPSVS